MFGTYQELHKGLLKQIIKVSPERVVDLRWICLEKKSERERQTEFFSITHVNLASYSHAIFH